MAAVAWSAAAGGLQSAAISLRFLAIRNTSIISDESFQSISYAIELIYYY